MHSMGKVMLSIDVQYIYSNLSITVEHHIFQILAYYSPRTDATRACIFKSQYIGLHS